MAKTPVTMKVGGYEDREVASFEYAFEQAVDKENQVAGIPRGGRMTIRVKALNEGDGIPQYLGWMLDKSKACDGELVIMQSKNAEKKLKSIEFTGAYCVNYTEHWEDAVGDIDLAHYEEISIVCKTIKVGTTEFENAWA